MGPPGDGPRKEALRFINSGNDKNSFMRQYIDQEKGYGVIAIKYIKEGEFLLEYVGRHISGSEGEELLKQYSAEDASILYFYYFQGQSFCVDASKHTGRLGRLMNGHLKKSNCKIKMVIDGQKRPHLCAFATSDISPGHEILYGGDNDCPRRQLFDDSSSLPAIKSPSPACSDYTDGITPEHCSPRTSSMQGKKRQRETDGDFLRLEALDQHREEREKQNTEETHFANLIAAMLVKFPPQLKSLAKFWIHELLFNMEQEFFNQSQSLQTYQP